MTWPQIFLLCLLGAVTLCLSGGALLAWLGQRELDKLERSDPVETGE